MGSSIRPGIGFGAKSTSWNDNSPRKSSFGNSPASTSKNNSSMQPSFLRENQQRAKIINHISNDESSPFIPPKRASTNIAKLPKATMKFVPRNDSKVEAKQNSKNDRSKTSNGRGKSTGGFNPVLFNQKAYAAQSKLIHQRSQQTLVAEQVSLEQEIPSPRTRRPIKKQKLKAASNGNLLQKAVTHASSNLSQLMDDLEESHRQQTSKERISECLVHLRAASERSRTLREYQQEELERSRKSNKSGDDDGDDGSRFSMNRSKSLRSVVGDMGLSLFSPLDLEAFELLDPPPPTAAARDEDEVYPVELVPEGPSVLLSCPRLLTPSMFEQLVENLPATVKTMTWKRLFALGRDGDSFEMMLDRVHSFTNTVVVVETTYGHILGGYASAPWNRQGGLTRSFYGSGQSFLFANHPDDGTDNGDDDKLHTYKWTGNNNYCQVCDVDDGQLAMGGGGAFGLIVEENFSCGSTGRCSTFDNPALIPSGSSSNRQNGGTFEVLNMEIYGFSSMVQAFSCNPSLVKGLPKQQSLLRQDSPMVTHRKSAF